MSGEIRVIKSLRSISQESFDALEPRTGPVGTYSRLLQLEADSRWVASYFSMYERDRLVGVVPSYSSKLKRWPDDSYNPGSWGHEGELVPEDCIMIGGRQGLASAFKVSPQFDPFETIESIVRPLRCEAKSIVFPYINSDQAKVLKKIFGNEIQTFALGKTASLDHHLGQDSPRMNDKVRRTIRLDLREEVEYEMTTEEANWDDIASWASPLIAEHGRAKGASDHSVLVNRRMLQWKLCNDIQVISLVVRSPEIEGVVVTLMTGDWMEVSEIGMPVGRSNLRRALYAMLMYHAPLRLARNHSMKHLRLGLGAETAKRARGADMQDIFGLVLPAAGV